MSPQTNLYKMGLSLLASASRRGPLKIYKYLQNPVLYVKHDQWILNELQQHVIITSSESLKCLGCLNSY